MTHELNIQPLIDDMRYEGKVDLVEDFWFQYLHVDVSYDNETDEPAEFTVTICDNHTFATAYKLAKKLAKWITTSDWSVMYACHKCTIKLYSEPDAVTGEVNGPQTIYTCIKGKKSFELVIWNKQTFRAHLEDDLPQLMLDFDDFIQDYQDYVDYTVLTNMSLEAIDIGNLADAFMWRQTQYDLATTYTYFDELSQAIYKRYLKNIHKEN